ncbi:MAG: radical SAM protein [Lentisphaerae bacterium]|nr:radical SAM protein [Lentisphaerota bacterium]
MKSFVHLAWRFLRLRPRVGQVTNAVRFFWCLSSGHPPERLPYKPISFGVHVTRRCNLACPFCYNRAVNRGDALTSDITVAQFSRLLEHPNLRPAFRVTFFGGEPLLHPDLYTLMRLARNHRKLTYVTTNALLLAERAEEMSRAPVDTVQVSLYADHLDRQIEGVRRLRRTAPRVSVVLSRIITSQPDSWQAMRQTVEIADELGVRKLLFMGYSPLSNRDKELCFFEDNTAMRDFLGAFSSEFGRRFDLVLPMPLVRDTRRRFCIAHYTAPYVAPDGSLAPCCEISPPSREVGSVFDEDFWNNAFFRRFRGEFVGGFPVHPRCRDCPTSSMGRAKGFLS